MDGKLTIGLLQRRAAADPGENLARTLDGIREAAKRGAQIVCLEELFRSPYFCREENHDNFALAEAIPGPSTDYFGQLAKKHNLYIVAGLLERDRQLRPLLLHLRKRNQRSQRLHRQQTPGFARNHLQKHPRQSDDGEGGRDRLSEAVHERRKDV